MWTKALTEMEQQNSKIYGPKSFIKYCESNNIQNAGRTASHISIDHYKKLHKQLKENQCMVLRLGSNNVRNGTNFVLVKHDQFRDFFFFDDEIFTSKPVEYKSPADVRNALSIMNIFEKPSEMMLVSYLLSSGALGEVLGLDEDNIYYTPLTGRNCFTFSYKPAPDYPLLKHENGQVEIDAVFTGKRNGKLVIVIAEAKSDTGRYRSLAKHKLFYAYKSVQEACLKKFEVIPIYLKLSIKDGVLKAKIAECEDLDGSLMGITVVSESSVLIEL